MRHDRPVDRRPASVGCTNTGKVLGSDVQGANAVGIGLVATVPAAEIGLGATIVTIDASATGTGLAGVPGVNPDNRAALSG